MSRYFAKQRKMHAFCSAGVWGTFFVVFRLCIFSTQDAKYFFFLQNKQTSSELLIISIGHQLSDCISIYRLQPTLSCAILVFFSSLTITSTCLISHLPYIHVRTREKNTIQIMTSASLHFISFSMHNFRCCCAVWVFRFEKNTIKLLDDRTCR